MIQTASDKNHKGDKDRRIRYGWWGAGITFAYIVFLIFILQDKLFGFSDLSLNEIGDFAAGVVGPIALLWLVIGFFQQSRELQNSALNLSLQTKELANSVEQYKKLADLTKDQLYQQRKNAILPHMPSFSVIGVNSGWKPYPEHKEISYGRVLEIFNSGQTVTEVKFTCTYNNSYLPKTEFKIAEVTKEEKTGGKPEYTIKTVQTPYIWPYFKSDSRHRFALCLRGKGRDLLNMHLIIDYKIVDGTEIQEEYLFGKSSDGKPKKQPIDFEYALKKRDGKLGKIKNQRHWND